MASRCYFFVKPFESCERFKSNYQHDVVALAEGFRALGIEVGGNEDYWPFLDGQKPLIPKQNLAVFKPDLVIVSGMYHTSVGKEKFLPVLRGLLNKGIQVVATDLHDGCITPSFEAAYREYTLVLKAHASRHFPLPNNTIPWAFGLTNRIIHATQPDLDFEHRTHQLLWNFRIPQGLRKKAVTYVEPRISQVITLQKAGESLEQPGKATPATRANLQHEINCHSGGRHHPAYFEKLRHSTVSACFGGQFSTRFFEDNFWHKQIRRINRRLPFIHPNLLYQWDSYRLWETLAAGCVAMHTDLEAAGCIFPEPMVKFKHYLGWNFQHPATNEAILDLLNGPRSQLEAIGHEGRAWAMAHYAPPPVALRLLHALNTR